MIQGIEATMTQASEILRVELQLRRYRKECAEFGVAENPGVVAALQTEIDRLKQTAQLPPALANVAEMRVALSQQAQTHESFRQLRRPNQLSGPRLHHPQTRPPLPV